MKVNRTTEIETNSFEVNDVISFELNDGEPVEAMAMRQEADGMVFLLVDCLRGEEPMNEEDSNRGGYEATDIRKKKLNSKILSRFPAEIQELMVPFSNGDMLRLPTEKEIFGKNEIGEDESDVEQFEPMKLRRNRISFKGLNGSWEWYWLATPSKRYASLFAYVLNGGNAYYSNASNSLGVRPAFKIKNL